MTKSIKISVLWLLTICGFAAHSIYDVLPSSEAEQRWQDEHQDGTFISK